MVDVSLRQVNAIITGLVAFLGLVGSMVWGIFQVASAINSFENKIDQLEVKTIQMQATMEDHSSKLSKIVGDIRIIQLKTPDAPRTQR